ncbi:MAG: NHL repeat-containing protein [Terracidiphilus sp.]
MRSVVDRTRVAVPTIGSLLLSFILIAGCGGSGSRSIDQGSIPTPPSATITGRMLGGQFPVTGATMQLYASGSTGYAAAAQPLFSPGAITTDGNGIFSFTTSDYTCPSPTAETYIVATGGNPGLGADNPYIALMTALGPCGQVGSLSFVSVNEVTTVASVWALAPFLGPGAQVGTSSTNAQGLANAFLNVNNLVDITKGTSPGASVPTGAVLPTKKIYTLANLLASCINSTGSTACDALFNTAKPPSGSAPTDTIGAALDIAQNPSNNVTALFALPTPQSPFQPGLSAAPNDWTIAVTFSGGGLDLPASIAIDALGNVWAANFCGSNIACSSVTELSSTGQPMSSSNGFADDALWESYGLAIDIHGSVWATNQQTPGGHGSVSELNTSGQLVSTFSGGGVYFPGAVATDTDGSIWLANYGDSTATKLSNSGSAVSGSGGWGVPGQLSAPEAVAIDANHYAWFANSGDSPGTATSISPNGTTISMITSGGNEPSGIATDRVGISTNASKGHVWVANYLSSSVSELELNNDGTVTVASSGYAGGGINHPYGIAVDGSGSVWVANWIGNSLTELQGASSTNPGQPLSPSSGLGADAHLNAPYGIALDSSGNIWLSNFHSDTITQFLGVATPVSTPLVGPPQVP